MGAFSKTFSVGGQIGAKLNLWVKSNLVIEGHSFLSPGSNLDLFLADKLNVESFHNSAISGSTVADIESRASFVDSKLTGEGSGLKNILILWIGVNDLSSSTYSDLESYVNDRIAAGWSKIFVFTMVKATGMDATALSLRSSFNNSLRNTLSSNKVTILDTDNISELDNPTNTTYFNADGLHLIDAGRILVADYFEFVLTASYSTAKISDFTASANFTSDSTGTGSGVTTLIVESETDNHLLSESNTEFFADAACSIGIGNAVFLPAETSRTFYAKSLSGSAILKLKGSDLATLEWIGATDSPSLGGDISQLDVLKRLRILTNTTIYGAITELINLNYIDVSGSNTLSGSVSALTALTFINVSGSNTLSGSVSNLINLTYLRITGNNTVSGDLGGDGTSAVCNGITLISLGPCAMSDYTAGATWSNATVVILPSSGYGYSSAEVDNILIDMANSGVMSGKTITLKGSSAARTSDSDSAVTALQAAGCTVTTN